MIEKMSLEMDQHHVEQSHQNQGKTEEWPDG